MSNINLKKTILQYRNPDINLDELFIIDISYLQDKNSQSNNKKESKQKKQLGLVEPFIKINNKHIKGISYFKLDLTSFIPTVIFKFDTISEKFISTSYPKDGDIASIFIRPVGKLFKPIRIDVIITKVISTFSRGVDYFNQVEAPRGKFHTYTIFGELRIPKLYKHISKAYKGNSSDVLIKIAEELSLGYASNEKSTNDYMTWISPNIDYKTFIKQVVNSAWLNEEDYFDCWIDQYYNINFINLRKQFDNTYSGLETMKIPFIYDERNNILPDTEVKEIEFPLLLTNRRSLKQSPLFITSFLLEHNAGNINNDLGYYQEIQFYDDQIIKDKPQDKYIKYLIESVTNKNLKDRDILHKGRINEYIYKEEIKKTYVGTIYFENVHSNFHQAQIQNILNRNDSNKLIFKVKNRMWTPFIYRGQSLPVLMVLENTWTTGEDQRFSPEEGAAYTYALPADKETPNLFLSGTYVVMGIIIEYTPSEGFYQTLLLSKKEWTLNPGTFSDPITLNKN